MDDGNRYGGTRRLGTLVVGRSDQLPDLVLKYEVVERRDDQYVLCRPGYPAKTFRGHVANFALLGTLIVRSRDEFNRSSRLTGTAADEAWNKERERLMSEWDAFPVTSHGG